MGEYDMQTVLIVHGVGGHPGENWFPWLKRELELLGCKVVVPQFPTPERQTLQEWMKVFESVERQLGTNPIVIGHSLGVAFLLNVLEQHPAKAAFLVAGFTGRVGNKFDESMKTFAQRTFGWNTIKAHCRKFAVFHSDNDEYVPLAKAEELAQHLGTEVILVKGAGHFNKRAGYTTFPLLLEKVRQEL